MSNGGSVEVKGENAFLAAARIGTGAIVVLAALAAAVVSLALILDNYDGSDSAPIVQTSNSGQTKAAGAGAKGGQQGGKANGNVTPVSTPVVAGPTSPTPPPTDTASVSASSVVAVLTPVIAGIVGIAGLFFSISATGSARGREADVEKVKAERDLVAEISSAEGKSETFKR